VREASGLVKLRETLIERKVPLHVVRYDDFIGGITARKSLADFTGWRGNGRTDAHLAKMDRGFEVDRHGVRISGRSRIARDRRLEPHHFELAADLRNRAAQYQLTFGY
jgi:hypothetical protein